jgi:hypothetical protein
MEESVVEARAMVNQWSLLDPLSPVCLSVCLVLVPTI